MKRIVGLSVTAFALVAAAGFFLTLGAPEELTAEGNCNCFGSVQETPILDGDCQYCTCQDATNDLLQKLRIEAGCIDGTCFEELVITSACMPHGPGQPAQGWWVKGKLRYKCYACMPCGPPPM